MIRYPKIPFTLRLFLVLIAHLIIITGLLYLGISVFGLVILIVLYIIIMFIWALSRTIPRTNRYKNHIKQFGDTVNPEEIDFDKVMSAAVPFENTRVITNLYLQKDGIVFGRKDVFRKLLLSDIDEVVETVFWGHPVIQVKLKDGHWEDDLYLPLDATFK